jgi:transcriptional regulator
VPTWNYALVHIEGKVTSVDNDKDGLRAFLETLVDTQETRTAESYPEHQAWRIDDAPPEYIAAQMRAIVKVEISVDSVFAKFKMSQNREPEDAQAVVRNLLCAGGDQSEELAALVGQCNKLDTASLLRHSGLRGRISVSAGLVHVGVGFAAGMCAAWWLLRK